MNNSKKRKRSTSWQLSTKSNIENQYQIDFGQKAFGPSQCKDCGIIYHIGDPDDENAHLNYHNNFKTLKFLVKEFINLHDC
jgi:N-acetyltransferase